MQDIRKACRVCPASCDQALSHPWEQQACLSKYGLRSAARVSSGLQRGPQECLSKRDTIRGQTQGQTKHEPPLRTLLNSRAACEELTACTSSNHSRPDGKATAGLTLSGGLCLWAQPTMGPILPGSSWQEERGEARTFLHPLTWRKRAQATRRTRGLHRKKAEEAIFLSSCTNQKRDPS